MNFTLKSSVGPRSRVGPSYAVEIPKINWEMLYMVGKGFVEPEYTGDPDGSWEWEESFRPHFCVPMADIIKMPTACPKDVSEELRSAFSLFWGNRTACAGRIRVALERLMTHLGVPKRKKAKNGKFFDLTLHARVDAFATKEPGVGPQLMALKWLGNAGSHEGEAVSRTDLLDAFEILEHALEEVIEQRSQKMKALAKKLTRKHKA